MLNRKNITAACLAGLILLGAVSFMAGCDDKSTNSDNKNVPHEGPWGIYALELATEETTLLYSTDSEMAGLNLNTAGTHLAFAIAAQSAAIIDSTSEIYTLATGSGALTRLTNNYYYDAYPSYSPTDSQIVFLSFRDSTLDLYTMQADGSAQQLLFNSGGHDADVDWGSEGRIAFTRDYQIWSVGSDGSNPLRVTDPEGAGTWGEANLPIGDYDPRFSPNAGMIAFERMVDVSFEHGGYDIYVVSVDGGDETNLTNTGHQGYAQGFANWSHAGDKLVYILSAIDTVGKFDLCLINADGSGNHIITPDYYPADFLCHNAVFSSDDSQIYFIGQWWE